MLVQLIFDFLNTATPNSSLISSDEILYKQLAEHFSGRTAESDLERVDIDFLLQLFTQRWQQVFDTEHDYTLNPSRPNLEWVKLAKNLAPFAERTYLQILFPSVKNLRDYNKETELTETQNIDNLYLDPNGTTLYRKKGLYLRLIENDFILSTNRLAANTSNNEFEICPLTIIELGRLKKSRRPFSESENVGSFANFWEFLRIKSFPKLNPVNQPNLLIGSFLGVLAKYYIVRKESKGFLEFKTAYHAFLENLYQRPLEDINQLYGLFFNDGDTKIYLVECLVELNNALSFSEDLDQKIHFIIGELYHIHPIRIDESSLNSLYKRIDCMIKEPGTVHLTEYYCKCILLSIFTYPFDPGSASETAFFLDIKKSVDLPVQKIYEKFYPYLKRYSTCNREPLNFDSLYTDIISYIRNNCSQLANQTWYKNVKNKNTTALGVRWADTELILHVLVHFKKMDSSSREPINQFIHELIRTFAQNTMSELQVDLRVNILFNRLQNTIVPEDLASINNLLKQYYRTDFKRVFVPNCADFIKEKINLIIQQPRDIPKSSAPVLAGTSPTRFFTIPSINSNVFEAIPQEVNSIRGLLDEFNFKLHRLDANPNICPWKDAVSTYLFKLNEPIKTHEELEEAGKVAQVTSVWSF